MNNQTRSSLPESEIEQEIPSLKDSIHKVELEQLKSRLQNIERMLYQKHLDSMSVRGGTPATMFYNMYSGFGMSHK